MKQNFPIHCLLVAAIEAADTYEKSRVLKLRIKEESTAMPLWYY